MDVDAAEPGRRLVIDVWSDVVCPFCYLGDTVLEQAIAELPHRDSIDVRYHSYQLMPQLPDDVAEPVAELLERERGYSAAQIEAMHEQLTARGAAVGIDFRFDQALAVNTRAAHRLSHFAAAHGRQRVLMQRLFRAYFSEGRNIGDDATLAALAAEVGLDADAAIETLGGGDHDDHVDRDIEQARQLGIGGVPFFVFDERFAVSGAQPVEAFRAALDRAWNDTDA